MRKSSNWPLITVLIITVVIGLSPMIIAELPNKIIYLLTRDGGGVGGSGNATSIAGTNVNWYTGLNINDVLTFDGTNITGGTVTVSATNATFGAKTNGTTVTATASAINFIYGSNVVIRTTNASGQVDIQISATGTGGSDSTNLTVLASGSLIASNNLYVGTSQQFKFLQSGGYFQLNNDSSGAGALSVDDTTDEVIIGTAGQTPLVTIPMLAVSASNNILGHLNVGSVLSTNGYITTDTSPYTYASSTNGPTGIASREIVTNIVNGLNLSGFSENTLQIFVATNGNDSTAILGDPSKPFLTIAAAASNIVNNSAVIIGPGEFTYVPTIQTNVVLDAPLNTPIGLDLVTNVTIIGSGPSTVFTSGTNWGEFINIREAENILIANFTVKDRQLTGPEHGTFAMTNYNWSAVRFIGTNTNIRITGIKFKDHTRQIIDHLYGPIRTTHVMVDHCWFENIGVTNVPGATTKDGAAFVGVGSNWSLENSTVTNALRAVELIHSRTPADTVQHSGIRIINNRFVGIWEIPVHTLSPYKDVLFENNLMTRTEPTTETTAYAVLLGSGDSELTFRGNTFVGWSNAILSAFAQTNMVIENNRFINNGAGVALYVASGDGNQSQGHVIRNNHFQNSGGPAILIGGVNSRIEGNLFLNCKTNSVANQGVIRMFNPTTNIVIRGNIYRAYNSVDTNEYCISLAGENHKIQDEVYQDYKTSIYVGTAPGTTFGFNNIPVNSATVPTDGDVITYISALNVYTNQPNGSAGEVNVLGDSSVTNATTISLAGIKSGSTLNLKTVRAGSGIVVTNEGTNVVIASTGVSASTNLAALFAGSLIASNNLYVGTAQQFKMLQSGGYFQLNNDSSGASAISVSDTTDDVIIGTAGQTPSVTIPMLAVSASNNILGHLNVGSIVSTNGYITTDASPYTYASSTNGPAGIASREIVTNIVNAIGGGSAVTNFVATTTDHGFVTNLYITGTGPGSVILSNSTGSSFVEITMSDAGTSKTNAFSFSTITDGQSVTFNGPNGTFTNEWVGQVADVITTNGTVIGLLHSRDNGTNYLRTITAGLNVTITNNGTNLVIASSGGGSASAVGGSGAIQFADGTSFYGTNDFADNFAFFYDTTTGTLVNKRENPGGGTGTPMFAAVTDTVGNLETNQVTSYGFSRRRSSAQASPGFLFDINGTTSWEMGTNGIVPVGANRDIGSYDVRVKTNWVRVVNTERIASTNFSTITAGQVLGFHDANGTVTNLTAGSSTPLLSTNVTAVSTNFHINADVAPANDTTFEIDLTANSGVTIGGGDHRQIITIAFLQDTDGEKTVALTNLFAFGLDLPAPLTLSTNGGVEDITRWMYHSSSNKWYHLGAVRGF